jgi:acetoin utilization deacetylase AcuC-like enzyme
MPQPFIAFDPIYAHPLPEGHRFPMLKYELIPAQLLHEGTITEDALFSPQPIPEAILLHTHDADYWHRMKTLNLTPREMRVIGFPLSEPLVMREVRILQGTLDCARISETTGVALNVAGGTHHAFADRGEGFCLLNDFAVAANQLIAENPTERILICDLDVHQGNGTAALLGETEQVFTFSMHGAHNYPFHKERSDLDIGLPDGISGTDYLDILHKNLPQLINRFRPTRLFYLSGVDVLATDKFGKLALTRTECAARDRFVLETAKQHSLPVTVAMGGGYSPDIKDIVEAHANTFRNAVDVFGL